jgi:hypothetical protein
MLPPRNLPYDYPDFKPDKIHEISSTDIGFWAKLNMSTGDSTERLLGGVVAASISEFTLAAISALGRDFLQHVFVTTGSSILFGGDF